VAPGRERPRRASTWRAPALQQLLQEAAQLRDADARALRRLQAAVQPVLQLGHVGRLALADRAAKVLVAAEDGILGIADAPRRHRPARAPGRRCAPSRAPAARWTGTQRPGRLHSQSSASLITQGSSILRSTHGWEYPCRNFLLVTRRAIAAALSALFHMQTLPTCRRMRRAPSHGGRQRRGGSAREEGAAAQHAGLQQAAWRAQEELHVVPARELRQPRVQLGRDDHRARQVRVHLRPPRARPPSRRPAPWACARTAGAPTGPRPVRARRPQGAARVGRPCRPFGDIGFQRHGLGLGFKV